ETFFWTRRQTVGNDEVGAELSKLCHIVEQKQNLIIGDRMHVIGLPDRSHFIFDLYTNVWSRVSAKGNVPFVESPTF
ncbi:hypothetical protein PENTCL1PPCAC_28127, partial [Pristionchus entomophagus]